MKNYRAVFFDLDHTLWDFETNSQESLADLFLQHELPSRGIDDVAHFIKVYKKVNYEMWDDYHHNRITKEQLRFGRFNRTLNEFKIQDDPLAELLSVQYLEVCPVKRNLFPNAIEVLQKLKEKYSLHIITNGFKEVQYLKIQNSGLAPYFDQIHISEEIGFKKPEPEIFHYAVKLARVSQDQCIMIGDNLDTDIAGALNAGIDHIYFNPTGEFKKTPDVMKEVKSLSELLLHL